jgi:hypothetical protein
MRALSTIAPPGVELWPRCAASGLQQSLPLGHTVFDMTNAEDAGAPIRFLTDGRVYESQGRLEGEFIAVFGELVAGPPFQPSLVIEFPAKLVRPDGSTLYLHRAKVDYPADPDLVEETEYMVLLYEADRSEVPAGTTIASLDRRSS